MSATIQDQAHVLAGAAGASGWTLSRRRATEHQRYLVAGGTETERTVSSAELGAVVFRDREGQQGSAEIVVPGGGALTSAQVAEALFRAGLARNRPYRLPEPEEAAAVESADPEVDERVRGRLDEVEARIRAAVAAEAGVRLSSAELFVTRTEVELLTSTGVAASWSETDVLLDLVLLAGDGAAGSESHGAYRTRRIRDVEVEAIVARHARFARDTLRAELPATRRGPVVLTESSFLPLLAPFRFATSGEALFRKVSPLAPGAPLLGSREVKGERLHLASDPTLPFAIASRPRDDEGLALRRVDAVADGVFRAPVADKRAADYLGIAATGEWTNTVVPAGATPLQGLLDPGGGTILHIVEFSWLNPNVVRGTFSTEIRLGYEIGPGGTRVVKGGSLAGNVYDAFAAARFSRETALLEEYQGPIAVRFEDVAVTAG